MKKKIIIILTSVLVLSLTLVGIVNAYQGRTVLLDEPTKPEEESYDELICSYEKTHPVLKRLSEQYEVVYEDLVDYFCDYEIGVGEIRHALETAKIVDEEAVTYETFLDMFIGGMDWGEIWQELGLIGFGEFGHGDDEGYDEGMNPICSVDSEFEHPALFNLAEMYEEVSYEDLVSYFCEGFGVGEIKHALETAEKTEGEDLWSDFLDMRKGEEEKGWGEIWQELGLIGKDKMDDDSEEYQNQMENKNNKGKPENHPGKGKGLDKKP